MAPTLRELALRYLRDKLQSGAFLPGSKLSELALAKAMGISRTPVREAIHQLCSEGILEMVSHAGVKVRIPTKKEIIDLYELREVLEGYAAEKATSSKNPEIMELLKSSYDGMNKILVSAKKKKSKLLSEKDTQQVRQFDLNFHMDLIKAADNQRMKDIICDSRTLGRLFYLMEPRMNVEVFSHACDYHGSVIDAIEAGDPTLARKKIMEHIRCGQTEMLKHYNSWHKQYNSDIPEALRKYTNEQ